MRFYDNSYDIFCFYNFLLFYRSSSSRSSSNFNSFVDYKNIVQDQEQILKPKKKKSKPVDESKVHDDVLIRTNFYTLREAGNTISI